MINRLGKILLIVVVCPAVVYGATVTPPVSPGPSGSSGPSTSATCCRTMAGPIVPPTTVDFTPYNTNGDAVAVIGPSINTYLADKGVKDFGFYMYLQDPNQSSTKSTGNPNIDLVNNHKNYCSKNLGAEFTGCQVKTGIKALDTKYLELGDVKFSSMIAPVLYGTDTALAAQFVIQNITNPLPKSQANTYIDAYTKAVASSKLSYAEYLTGQAIIGVALHSLNEMYSMRLAGGAYPAPNSQTSSLLSVMEDEATRRFEKKAFTTFLAASTTSVNDVWREIAAMDAFKQWMDYQIFKQDERIVALLAVSLAKYSTSKSLAEMATK